jgi:hypothetical protein
MAEMRARKLKVPPGAEALLVRSSVLSPAAKGIQLPTRGDSKSPLITALPVGFGQAAAPLAVTVLVVITAGSGVAEIVAVSVIVDAGRGDADSTTVTVDAAKGEGVSMTVTVDAASGVAD